MNPQKMTKEIYERILSYIAKGITQKDACTIVGMNYNTFTRWHCSVRNGVEITVPDRFNWNEDKKVELCSYLHKSPGNLLLGFEAFATKYNTNVERISTYWYLMIKPRLTEPIFATVGGVTLMNSKNIHRNAVINENIVQETPQEVKESLNFIKLESSSFNWDFQYTYKKGKRK